MQVSEYTDNVDIVRGFSFRTSKQDVMKEEVADLFQLLSGLLVSGNYKEGVALLGGEDKEDNKSFFKACLEVWAPHRGRATVVLGGERRFL